MLLFECGVCLQIRTPSSFYDTPISFHLNVLFYSWTQFTAEYQNIQTMDGKNLLGAWCHIKVTECLFKGSCLTFWENTLLGFSQS